MATVRIDAVSHRQLRQMAEESGHSMSEIVADAIDSQYRKWLLEGLADDYAKLRSNPKAWREELAERNLWV